MKSIFTNEALVPSEKDVMDALGTCFSVWNTVAAFTHTSYPGATASWKYGGEKSGWSYRISDSKRVLVYLLPRSGFFKVAMVFGSNAYEQVIASDINSPIKEELEAARPYAEGRGIRIDVTDDAILDDIKKLIRIKTGTYFNVKPGR
jgi:hypothetical protein